MADQHIDVEFRSPFHFAWWVIHYLVSVQAPPEAIAEAFRHARQDALDRHSPSRTVTAARRLGFFWPMGRATARLRNCNDRTTAAYPVIEILSDFGSNLIGFTFHGPAEFTNTETKALCEHKCYAYGYYDRSHPYAGGNDIGESEWGEGDAWHWLWALCHSQTRPEQGERAYQALCSRPECQEHVIDDGLLPTIAQNLFESQIRPDERFDCDEDYYPSRYKTREYSHTQRTSEMGRFCALYTALRQLLPDWSHDQTCQYLCYPDPRGVKPTNHAIDLTLARMRDWLE